MSPGVTAGDKVGPGSGGDIDDPAIIGEQRHEGGTGATDTLYIDVQDFIQRAAATAGVVDQSVQGA